MNETRISITNKNKLMVDYTPSKNELDHITSEFNNAPKLHASEDTLNFIRFFAYNYKPLAEV